MLAVELVAQRRTAHVGEHAVQQAARFPRVEELEDVRVVEPRRDPDLGEESLGAEHGTELGAQDLEGDLTIELPVAGEVDDGHATGADLALDDVAVVERRGDQGWVRHTRNLRTARAVS